MCAVNGTKQIYVYFQQQQKKCCSFLDKELRVVKIQLHPREILTIHFQDLQLRKEIPHVRY